MKSITDIIRRSLDQDEFSDFSEFEQCVLASDKTQSLLVALELAMRTTTIGQAFAIGYRCALQNLLPDLIQDEWGAFCVTEKSGVHPKKLTTTVSESGVLNGHKSFVSMADVAKELIVIAKTEDSIKEERPVLKAVRVKLPLKGAEISMMPSMGMMPEIGHGTLQLNNVQGQMLVGDGYLNFNKRFRAIEDAHLIMAFTSLILSKSIRYKLNDELIDDALVIISAIMMQDYSDEAFSVLQLNGINRLLTSLNSRFENELEKISDDFKCDWVRDAKIFSLAGKARALKRERAIEPIHS